jgi:hypothetical protein
MNPRTLEEEARRCAMHLVDLIQTAAIHSPRIVIALDQAARAFVAEERRRSLAARIASLDGPELAELDALIGQMERNRTDEAPVPPPGSA